MEKVLSQETLEDAHCWEADDHVPRQPALTEFRRRLRYHQSKWREANGHPIGSQPIAPRSDAGATRPVGSRLPLDYAKETGATFVTASALDAARARTSFVEPHQSFDHQRLWAELLWSPTLAFNLFGDLADDLALADRAVHTWWPDVPGTRRRRPLRALAGASRSGVARQPRRVRRRVRARARRRHAGDPRTRDRVPRRQQAAAAEADSTAAVLRDHRDVRRFPARGDRRGQRNRAHPHLARPPPRTVDAPASERHVALGPARRRPSSRQHRLRRRVQPLPGAARRTVDVRLRDGRGAPRCRCPPGSLGLRRARAVHPAR